LRSHFEKNDPAIEPLHTDPGFARPDVESLPAIIVLTDIDAVADTILMSATGAPIAERTIQNTHREYLHN
jgi:hypothetical protein